MGHHWLNLPFRASSFAIVIFGLLLNGWIAAVEDHWQVVARSSKASGPSDLSLRIAGARGGARKCRTPNLIVAI